MSELYLYWIILPIFEDEDKIVVFTKVLQLRHAICVPVDDLQQFTQVEGSLAYLGLKATSDLEPLQVEVQLDIGHLLLGR